MRHITVMLLTDSAVLTAGLRAIISATKDVSITTLTVTAEEAEARIGVTRPAVVIADPLLLPPPTVNALRSRCEFCPAFVSFAAVPLPRAIANAYDANMLLTDTQEDIIGTITKLTAEAEAQPDTSRELSPREKDVVVGIVKGLSNKEIAAEINVSVNTVMTHRRNIAAKLQIHSAAGLTIYAIVSKLVNIEDIKDTVS